MSAGKGVKHGKRVWIDCGHGGKDPGALGPSGVKEKDIVLSVGLLYQARLIAAGFEVGMTRKTDEFIPLSKRAEAANEFKADLFISLHCNSAENAAMGIETFIARRTKVSFPAADAIQDALMDEFQAHTDRGVKRADYTVLKRTAMAAVLVELEFIHVACGEAHLSDKAVQGRYAKALTVGTCEFFDVPLPGTKPLPADGPAEPPAHPPLTIADRIEAEAKRLMEIATMAREQS